MTLLYRKFRGLLRLRKFIAVTILFILLYMINNMIHDRAFTNKLVKESVNDFQTIDYFVPISTKKIDWHDYKMIEYEKNRVGIGEQGAPAYMPKEDELASSKLLYARNGFNAALSDRIALNRSIPDIRHEGCKKRLYIEDLPSVSVVVPFFDEHWSTLLRTAYSVFNRSPKHLIKEFIFVDDGSTWDFLKQKLDDYVKEFMPKAKVIRLPERYGLITARLAGAKAATGDVIVFLDSHSEVNVNWLPPLLEPIALNYHVVVCPFIDVIAYDTFEYRAQDEGRRGAFDWALFYKRLPLLPKDIANLPEPFDNPVMAGGYFAISRKYFWELGGYDPGLEIWGGEQYELSFKIWQCGGRLRDAPCSRAGHVYRSAAPARQQARRGDVVSRNYRRVAEVWMDEYAQYVYMRQPQVMNIDPGDLTAQWEIRRRLKCKPFKWFITQVAFDLPGHYPPVEPKPFAQGRITTFDGRFCVDAKNGKETDRLQLAACGPLGEQNFEFTWHKDIRSKSRNICWDVPDSAPYSPVLLYSCHLGGGNQRWEFLLETKQFRTSSHVCLEWDPKTLKLYVDRCERTKITQRWSVYVDEEAMARWNHTVQPATGPLPYHGDSVIVQAPRHSRYFRYFIKDYKIIYIKKDIDALSLDDIIKKKDLVKKYSTKIKSWLG